MAALAAARRLRRLGVQPRRLLDHARGAEVVHDPSVPAVFDAWARELRSPAPRRVASRGSRRPLLIVHGSDDEFVPIVDARVLVDAHGAAELRIVPGAGHHLRHDPRAVAILLGWLERQAAATG